MGFTVHLVNPSSNLEIVCGDYAPFHTPIPPTSLAKLAAVLREAGHTVRLFDQFATRETADELAAQILADRPEVVGFSVLSPAMGMTENLVRRLRAAPVPPLVILGNTHATLFDADLLRLGFADYVVRGEGERSLVKLLAALEAKTEVAAVQGVSYLRDGQPVRTADQPQILELSELPFPAWDLLDLRRYRGAPLLGMHGVVLPVQAARGCPYRCIYCAQDKVYKKFVRRPVENVVDEMEHFHRRFNVSHFGFIDAFFPPDIQYGHAFAAALARRGLPIRFSTETRVDRVDAPVLQALAKVGLRSVMFGFEVGDEEILAALKKNQTLDQCRAAVRAARAAGLTIVGFFVIGLPGETVATIRKTVDFALELDVDIAKFNMAVPFPGTEFYQQVYGEAAQPEFAYEQFSSWYSGTLAGYACRDLRYQDLRRLQNWAMWRFYARPSIVWRHLRNGTIRPRHMALGAAILLKRRWRDLWAKSKKILPQARHS